ncbi:MAG TPA: hypothetical protein VFG86_08600, partial [Chloroflexota bacterium]|nr:hypothetical protein [Chloroflexota bacterium]
MALAAIAPVAHSYSMGSAIPEPSPARPRVWVARDLFQETIAPLHRAAGRVVARYPRLSGPETQELRRWLLLGGKRAGLILASLSLLFAAWAVHYVYVDHSDMPDLEAFVRFELPGTGEVYDTQGRVLIQLA